MFFRNDPETLRGIAEQALILGYAVLLEELFNAEDQQSEMQSVSIAKRAWLESKTEKPEMAELLIAEMPVAEAFAKLDMDHGNGWEVDFNEFHALLEDLAIDARILWLRQFSNDGLFNMGLDEQGSIVFWAQKGNA